MEDGQKKRGKMTLSMCGVECMSAKIYYLTRRFLCISLFTWCVLIYWLIWNYHTTSWFFVIYSLSFVFIVASLHIFLCVGLCLRNMLCLDLFWKTSMFLIWIAGCAVSFVAIFFYGYKNPSMMPYFLNCFNVVLAPLQYRPEARAPLGANMSPLKLIPPAEAPTT